VQPARRRWNVANVEYGRLDRLFASDVADAYRLTRMPTLVESRLVSPVRMYPCVVRLRVMSQRRRVGMVSGLALHGHVIAFPHNAPRLLAAEGEPWIQRVLRTMRVVYLGPKTHLRLMQRAGYACPDLRVSADELFRYAGTVWAINPDFTAIPPPPTGDGARAEVEGLQQVLVEECPEIIDDLQALAEELRAVDDTAHVRDGVPEEALYGQLPAEVDSAGDLDVEDGEMPYEEDDAIDEDDGASAGPAWLHLEPSVVVTGSASAAAAATTGPTAPMVLTPPSALRVLSLLECVAVSALSLVCRRRR
jgi:hypothetical protein